jgi:hypothetical protein
MNLGQSFRHWLRGLRTRAAKTRGEAYKNMRERLRALANFRQQ